MYDRRNVLKPIAHENFDPQKTSGEKSISEGALADALKNAFINNDMLRQIRSLVDEIYETKFGPKWSDLESTESDVTRETVEPVANMDQIKPPVAIRLVRAQKETNDHIDVIRRDVSELLQRI